ncbi:MAG: PqqD family protein [Faecalibacillus sp.]
MKVKDGFVLREICGENIVIPTGEATMQFNGLMTINEVGVSLWKLLNSNVSFDDLVKGILDEYDIDEDTARNDIQEFIDYLDQYHILDK